MSRGLNREVMGFFAIGEKHHEAILSLIAPSITRHARMLDPFAGEGDFLQIASKRWNVTPYANELDKTRANICIAKFGADNAVQGDVERLSASLEAFSIGWYNPPYDNDKLADTSETPEAKRIEYRYLRHAWKWIQTGGIVMWVVYKHHITDSAATFLSRYSSRVDIWGLEGKHLGEFDQVVVVAIKGKPTDQQLLYDHIQMTKGAPRPLTVQPTPLYIVPPPPTIARFVFAPNEVSPELGLKFITERGAHHTPRFTALFAPPPDSDEIETIVPPRPGHMAYVLAGAATSGIVMDTETYGVVAMRSVVEHVEERSESVITSNGSEQTTVSSKPRTSITLLAHDGTIIPLTGDEALLAFIVQNKSRLIDFVKTRFKPLYDFDYGGFKPILDGIRLNGKHALFTPQKHVIGAILRGFEKRKGILLIGQMGVGKTGGGGTVATIIGSGAHPRFRRQVAEGGVVLVVCPPHLVKKWKRETLSINPNAIIHQVNRHEDMKAFMDIPSQLGHPKIAIIKRDMTKLGSGWREAVAWQTKHKALWEYTGTKEEGRIESRQFPHCPHCHEQLTSDEDTRTTDGYLLWLRASKRTCPYCHAPLWQEIRPDSTRDDEGRIIGNPRYRLNQTADLCRVVYFYYADTMEQRAILLMSKKQRSSKLLTGDIGLSGLDALTEKEGNFEQALMSAVGKDERLEAPDFTRENSQYAEFDNADLAFWNVETPQDAPATPRIRTERVVSATEQMVAYLLSLRGTTPTPPPPPQTRTPIRETVLGSDGEQTIVQLRLF